MTANTSPGSGRAAGADDAPAPEAAPVLPPGWPDRRYAVIVADPPWQYQKKPGSKSKGVGDGKGAKGIAERHYPTMPNEDIAALPVERLALPDAHLFMWITNPFVYGGRFSRVSPFDLAAAWGFQYQTLVTWVKTASSGEPLRNGMGWYFRGCTEHVLYATRGRARIAPGQREPNVLLAPRGAHSAKPEEFLDMVERLCDGPYLELFSRRRRPGWDAWGNQVDDGTEAGERPDAGSDAGRSFLAGALPVPRPSSESRPARAGARKRVTGPSVATLPGMDGL